MTPGDEVALAAAFGAAADALAVTTPSAAAEAIRLLRKQDAGRAALLLSGAADDVPRRPGPTGRRSRPTSSAPPSISCPPYDVCCAGSSSSAPLRTPRISSTRAPTSPL
ncbi:hypothetical protein SALBM311S_04633 [Streptomyces alboniger]